LVQLRIVRRVAAALVVLVEQSINVQFVPVQFLMVQLDVPQKGLVPQVVLQVVLEQLVPVQFD